LVILNSIKKVGKISELLIVSYILNFYKIIEEFIDEIETEGNSI